METGWGGGFAPHFKAGF